MPWRPRTGKDNPEWKTGQVYVLHFTQKYKHAGHYIGWSENAAARVEEHRAGHGSPLVKAAVAAGSEILVAQVIDGVTRDEERRLKNYGAASRVCAICKSHPLKGAAA